MEKPPDGAGAAAEPVAILVDFIRAWDLREQAIRAHFEADDRLEAAEARALAVFRANGYPLMVHDYLGTVRLDHWDGAAHLTVVRSPWSHELKPGPRAAPPH